MFEEPMRFETLVQVFFRTATRNTELAGVEISEDGRAMICFGVATAIRVGGPRPRVDITHKASGHLAFGHGLHGWVGKPAARVEGGVLLEAARKVGRIELDGEPQRHLNNISTAYSYLRCVVSGVSGPLLCNA